MVTSIACFAADLLVGFNSSARTLRTSIFLGPTDFTVIGCAIGGGLIISDLHQIIRTQIMPKKESNAQNIVFDVYYQHETLLIDVYSKSKAILLKYILKEALMLVSTIPQSIRLCRCWMTGPSLFLAAPLRG